MLEEYSMHCKRFRHQPFLRRKYPAQRVPGFSLRFVIAWLGLCLVLSGASVGADSSGSSRVRYRIAAGDPQTPVAQAIGVAFRDSIRFMERLWQTQLNDPVELYLCDDSADLTKKLVLFAHEPADRARSLAEFSAACVSNGRLFIKRSSFERMEPAQMYRIICHETVHLFQKNHLPCIVPTIPAQTWLIEGYAELVSHQFLAARGWESWQSYCQEIKDIATALVKSRKLPHLSEINGASLVPVANRYGAYNLYALAAAATYLLFNQAGNDHRVFARYFNESPTPEQFAAHFGASLERFQFQFSQYFGVARHP